MKDRAIAFDHVGYWSEVKLDIVRKYAKAYSTILSAQRNLHHVYIDGFAGAGVHVSRATGDFVLGSPLNALTIQPPFKEHFLIDLDGDRIESLRELVRGRADVHLFQGDCNQVLLEKVFPLVEYRDFRRGLCLIDPYGLHARWEVLERAGRMGTIDLFLNFPIMDMNRNVLWRASALVDQDRASRMTEYWGDESWKTVAYKREPGLFGDIEEKTDNEAVVEAFRNRLRDVARFEFVPAPMPMRNSAGAVVYYLFFASQKSDAQKIVLEIFEKHRDRGELSMGRSSIEWTETTWNPLTGCTKISPGCKHCYAERMAKRLQGMGVPSYRDGFRLTLHEHLLDAPLRWRKPQTVFVNSMSDLFHRDVPDEFILRAFEVMRRASWHRFQVLTKRAERVEELDSRIRWAPNVWMGVSVETPEYAWRIDHLRRTEARVKFLSLEPLLSAMPALDLRGIGWVIVGGESGPGARPMVEEWVRDLREQCSRAEVPFFFKQWGGVWKKRAGRLLDGRTWDEMPGEPSVSRV